LGKINSLEKFSKIFYTGKYFNKFLVMKKNYGKELILDLIGCGSKIIRSKKKFLEYSNKLCGLLKVKKYGKPICERFALHLDQATG